MNYFDVKEFEDLLLKWQTVASEENHENKTILWVATTNAKWSCFSSWVYLPQQI